MCPIKYEDLFYTLLYNLSGNKLITAFLIRSLQMKEIDQRLKSFAEFLTDKFN